MKTHLSCLPCFIRQASEAVSIATNDQDIQVKVLRQVLRAVSEMDLLVTPPEMGQVIHRWVREFSGQTDPYTSVKKHFNDKALALAQTLRQDIFSAKDPLIFALRIAMAGNVIDFGVNNTRDIHNIEQTIKQALQATLDPEILSAFQYAVNTAETILYIADNAGEIVFDGLLIEQLGPERITLVVRGDPILNDATLADADYTGLTDLVKVITNGSDAPGTILQDCSERFMRHFNQADLIISKGQGNYETLNDIQRNIFFILKAKCPVAANTINCELGSWVFTRNSNH